MPGYQRFQYRHWPDGGIPPLGGELRRDIDQEIRRLLDEAYKAAEELIDSHADDVHAIAQALLARETLTAEEVGQLLEDVTHTEPVEACS